MINKYLSFADNLIAPRPNMPNREQYIAQVDEIFDRKWLTNDGPKVREFERAICEGTGVLHCVAVANGTLALEIAIKALGIEEVAIVPSFTFPATAHAAEWLGVQPFFADIEPGGVNLDPDCVKAIAPMLPWGRGGIIATHTYGIPCDTEAIEEIAATRDLKVLYDAAHAFGNTHKGKMIGNFGHAEIFSFHATKFIQAIEGGAIVTNDRGVAERARQMRNFGFTDYDRVERVGINAKMSEFHAAMGLLNLGWGPLYASHNKRLYEWYSRLLAEVEGVAMIPLPQDDIYNYQYIVLRVTDSCPVSRDALHENLLAAGILTRRYFYPGLHRQPAYSWASDCPLPHTNKLADEVLVLPAGTGITIDNVHTICAEIEKIVYEGSPVRT